MVKTRKEIFLARLMLERDKFELLLNRVGYTRRMTLKGVSGKWSVKDLLAHVLAYELYIADRMDEILHGEQYTPCRTQNALDELSFCGRRASNFDQSMGLDSSSWTLSRITGFD